MDIVAQMNGGLQQKRPSFQMVNFYYFFGGFGIGLAIISAMISANFSARFISGSLVRFSPPLD